jgi:chromosome partitioning protein
MAAREAVGAADIILVPVRARAFDLHAVATTAALVKGASSPPGPVQRHARACSPPAGRGNRCSRQKGLSVCPEVLTERARFPRGGRGQSCQRAGARRQGRCRDRRCLGMAVLTG